MTTLFDAEKVIQLLEEATPDQWSDLIEGIVSGKPELADRLLFDLKSALMESDSEYYSDLQDGDHASALASAGWGTDEDYGYCGDEWE